MQLEKHKDFIIYILKSLCVCHGITETNRTISNKMIEGTMREYALKIFKISE